MSAANAIKKIERDISTHEKKLATIEATLSDSSLYEEENKAKLQKLLIDQGEARQAHEQAEEQWLDLNQQLEELQEQL